MRTLAYQTMTVLFLVLWLVLFLLALRTWQMERSPYQARFQQGSAIVPDGLYSGTVPGFKVSWQGKKFDALHKVGINFFSEWSVGTRESYPFKTSLQKGVVNTELDVIGIDYNVKGNPFWLRLVFDEIVEIEPNEYLGMLHLRIIPGYPFTLAYFELKK